MKLIPAAVLSCFCLCSLFACDRGAANPAAGTGTVGIVNLDEVARSMGWLTDMEKDINARSQELQIQFNALQKNIAAAIETQKHKMTTPPTAEQEKTLNQLTAEGNTRLTEAYNQARREVADTRVKLAMQYRDMIRPVATTISKSKGMSIVLSSPADSLICFEPAVDITQAVIEELRKNPPRPAAQSPTSQPALSK